MKNSNSNAKARKKVIQCYKDGTEVRTHASISNAARAFNVSVANLVSSIGRVTKKGNPRTCGGWVWKYTDNEVD
jgi:hypothetical protein